MDDVLRKQLIDNFRLLVVVSVGISCISAFVTIFHQRYQQKENECAELAEKVSKMTSRAAQFEQLISEKQVSIEELSTEMESLKTKEKEQKVALIEMKNELFVSQRNSEIEVEALKGQVSLKDLQIEQLEKELSKTKLRLERQVSELKKDIQSQSESFKCQQQSLHKTMEAHFAAKDKKIADMKQALLERQQEAKKLQENNAQLSAMNENLVDAQAKLSAEISTYEASKRLLNENYEQLKQQLEDLKERNEKQMEEMQIIHNEQIDQKNEQIQTFMIENQTLNSRIEQSQVELLHFKSANASLLSEISVKAQNYKALSEQNTTLQLQMQNNRKQFDERIAEKQRQIGEVKTQLKGKLSQTLNQFKQLKGKLQEADSLSSHVQKEKEELLTSIKSYQGQIQKHNNESSDFVNTISLLTQENYGLNQQLSNHFNEKKMMQETLANLEASHLKAQSKNEEIEAQISRLSQLNQDLNSQLQILHSIDLDNKQKLVELNSLTNQLTKSLESERLAGAKLMNTNNSLEQTSNKLRETIMKLESDLAQNSSDLRSVKTREVSLSSKIDEFQAQNQLLLQQNNQLTVKLTQISDKCTTIESQLVKANEQLKSLSSLHNETKEKQGKQINVVKTQNTFLIDENRKQASEIINLSKCLNEVKLENAMGKQKINKFEQHHQKLNGELEELHLIKQKWQLQVNEMDKIRNQIEEERGSKERIYNQLCREKESNSNLKMLIENKSAQYMQLELQLEEKDAIYKKLVEKIAKNESENKKTTNSEHYLKTIELLEKSRAEQIELRRQNEQLKKVMMTMKETIEQKQGYAKEVENKAEGYCISMHKRLEEIQNDYVELERNHEKLIKEKKHYSHDNQQLKDEIKALKTSVAKLQQENKEMDSKIKKASIDYLQLEEQYKQIKRNESIIPINEQKERTNYINRLKAEVAALKTEKVLTNETLQKQRDEKTKLKAEMRYGKDGNTDITVKLDLEKKINENKNLTELIFEIISQLKICVNEPKTKLEVIRTTILGAIKEKNNEIKTLKEKIKECENEHYRQVPTKIDYPIVHRENRELKALSITNTNKPIDESLYKFEKDKDPSFLNNNSRQKMKEFEKYYAKFKSNNDGESKAKNI